MSSASSVQLAELEHAMGFNGGVPGALHVLPPSAAAAGMLPACAAEVPSSSSSGAPASIRCISAVGACAVVSDLLDPHAQSFLRGHAGALSAVALSPTARLLATGERGYDSDVCVWELASGRVLHRLQEHDHGISALAFSDDERLLATVGAAQDGLILIWDLATGAQVTRLRAEPAPTLCAAWGGFVKDIKGRDTALYQLATGEACLLCLPLLSHSFSTCCSTHPHPLLSTALPPPPPPPPLPQEAARACPCGP
jgi:WD40 repeat protein